MRGGARACGYQPLSSVNQHASRVEGFAACSALDKAAVATVVRQLRQANMRRANRLHAFSHTPDSGQGRGSAALHAQPQLP